jgi:hypothetical protein
LNIKVPTQLNDTQRALLRQLDKEFKSAVGK